VVSIPPIALFGGPAAGLAGAGGLHRHVHDPVAVDIRRGAMTALLSIESDDLKRAQAKERPDQLPQRVLVEHPHWRCLTSAHVFWTWKSPEAAVSSFRPSRGRSPRASSAGSATELEKPRCLQALREMSKKAPAAPRRACCPASSITPWSRTISGVNFVPAGAGSSPNWRDRPRSCANGLSADLRILQRHARRRCGVGADPSKPTGSPAIWKPVTWSRPSSAPRES